MGATKGECPPRVGGHLREVVDIHRSIDTGMDMGHVDIIGHYASQRDYTGTGLGEGCSSIHDDSGHATSVGGIASASTNNSVGIAGMAWSSMLRSYKIQTINALGQCDIPNCNVVSQAISQAF